MFKLGEHKVFFKHYPEEWGYIVVDEPGFERNPETPYKGKTVCSIELNDVVIAHGDAYCSVNDIFDKAKGRKVSLGRAIESFTKEARKLFWDEYIKITSRL